jgi:hypothetical protein
MDTRLQKKVSQCIFLWMLMVTLSLSYLSHYANDEQKKFYQIGPNDHLMILGFHIDTYGKYIAVVGYSFINSMIRTLHSSFLHPWLINHIQDETKEKPISIRTFAYEVTFVTTIYVWFDWFIYMNILLSQIDMMIIEMIADVIMSSITTYYYLKTGPETIPLV